MNIENIKNIDLKKIKEILFLVHAKIRDVGKNIISLPYAKVYLASIPALIIFFVIITFPLEILVKNTLHTLEGSAFRSVQSGYMSIGLFRDWEIESLSITTNARSEISFTNVLADISTFSLISKHISGTVEVEQFKYSTDSVTASCALKNGETDILIDSALGMPVGGKLSFSLTDIAIKGIELKGFNIPPVKAGTIKANILFSPRLMTISECIISGKDLSGRIRGTIALDPNMQRSQLNITCEIDAKSPLLSDYRMLLGSFINPATDLLTITITGPLAAPNTNMGSAPPPGGPPPFSGFPPLRK